jgi:hypothetical protein
MQSCCERVLGGLQSYTAFMYWPLIENLGSEAILLECRIAFDFRRRVDQKVGAGHLLYYFDQVFRPCYTLHIEFMWEGVQLLFGAVTLNRELRVHFGHLGRIFRDFRPKTDYFRPCYALLTKCKSVQFSNPRYTLHEHLVEIVQY